MNRILHSFIAATIASIACANTIQRDFESNTPTILLGTEITQTINPQATTVEDEWIKIGSGAYTDVVISSISRTKPEILSVDFEQNVNDPNIYRIKSPYANWDNRNAEKLVTYYPERATPMIIHVVDNQYAWFEEFNTGFYIDTEDEYGPIVGDITVSHKAEGLIEANGLEIVLSLAPSAMCMYVDGTMTLTAECSYPTFNGTVTDTNVRIDVGGEPMWRGNHNGDFCLQLPSAKDLNPEMKWNTLEGKAKFTDAFTALFAYQDEPAYPTFNVEIQQNEADPTIYRLVNPFAEWDSNYTSYDFNYDDENNYYITIYTYPEQNLACTNTFLTGLNVRVKENIDPTSGSEFEMFGIQNQAYYFYESYASYFGWYLSEVAEEFPYMFGSFKDGVLTYPAYYEDEYSGQIMQFPTFTGWTGSYRDAEENGYTYAVNKMGNFKVIFPNAKEPDAIINTIINDEEYPTEYYNLQGIRLTQPQPGTLVIECRGSHAVKKIYR